VLGAASAAEAATSHRHRLSVHIKVRDGCEKSPKRIAKQPQKCTRNGACRIRVAEYEKIHLNHLGKTKPLFAFCHCRQVELQGKWNEGCSFYDTLS